MAGRRAVENVWDYPRPPRLERVEMRLTVSLGGVVIADAASGWRVLETSHPPTYYLPYDAISRDVLRRTERTSVCEFKGAAAYFGVYGGRHRDSNGHRGQNSDGQLASAAAWTYLNPTTAFAPLLHHVAFYAEPMDACTVDGETVEPQPGNFYGGWVTSWIKGPFKGGPGTMGW